jgi:hypothetical protein
MIRVIAEMPRGAGGSPWVITKAGLEGGLSLPVRLHRHNERSSYPLGVSRVVCAHAFNKEWMVLLHGVLHGV